jgi:hypothetical protein
MGSRPPVQYAADSQHEVLDHATAAPPRKRLSPAGLPAWASRDAGIGLGDEKKRPAAQVAQLYRLVVSQITLLYMRDLFEADPDM